MYAVCVCHVEIVGLFCIFPSTFRSGENGIVNK